MADPLVAQALARLWHGHGCAAELAPLAHEAVALARWSSDARSRAWAHLSRAVLLAQVGDVNELHTDLVRAADMACAHDDAQARRWQDIAHALLLLRERQPAAARARLAAVPLHAAPGEEALIDAFVLDGRARAARALDDVDAEIEALHAGVMLSARCAWHRRHAEAATRLAELLVSVGAAREGLHLLDQAFMAAPEHTEASPWIDARWMRARCLHHEGEAAQALRELQALAGRAPGLGFGFELAIGRVECEIALGQFHRAGRVWREAREAAAGRPDAEARCAFHGGVIAAQRGDDAQALRQWSQSLDQFLSVPAAFAAAAECDTLGARLADALARHGDHAGAYRTQLRFHPLYLRRAAHVCACHGAWRRAMQAMTRRIRLSPRETECLRWCAAGKTAWETGRILGVSEWTVIYHLDKAKRKFGLSSRQQVLAQAVSLGFVEEPGADAALA